MSDFLLFTAGFFIALFVVWKLSKEKLYSERVIFDTVILTSIFAAIGSRIFYVLFHLDNFGFNILKWVVVGLYPGLSIGGALLGAGIALWIVSDKKTVVPFPELVDVITRAFLWVVSVPLLGFLFISPEKGQADHPITLYRLVNTLIVLSSMAAIFNRKRRLAPGTYSAIAWLLFVIGYLLIDFFNAHDVYYWKLSLDQWVYSVFILIITIILLFQIKQKAFFQHKKII